MADPTAPPTGDPNAAAYPPQQGYPPQTYPPQQPPAAGYPPQQPGYPPQQPGYPPQQPAAYPPPQAGYPPQPDAGAPPSYYQPQPGAYPPQQPQKVATDTTNVVVVQQQPTATVQTTVYTRRYGSNDHGLLFAIIASCIVFWCGGWCGLICTLAGIYFALQAQQQEYAGNVEATAQNHKWSYILSIVGLVVGFGFLFLYIIGGAAS